MFFLKNHVEKVKIENIKSNEVYAPVEGEVIPLDEVDDAVFSEKILGDGVAVEPDKGEIYSPVKGTVSVVFPTKHVVGITTEEGANIILRETLYMFFPPVPLLLPVRLPHIFGYSNIELPL